MTNYEWKWWVGHNEERYHTPCETREEAIDIASKEQGGGFIVEAKKATNIDLSGYFTADDFLEQAEDRAYDDYGDPEGGAAVFDVSAKQQRELQALVRTTIKEWQATNGLTFKGWLFSDQRNEEYIPAAAET